MSLGLPIRTSEGGTQRLNLRSRIFSALEESILTGRYPAGSSLTEKDLCEEFGVSRTPLREALCQLELQGLVECIPNKGAVVLGISPKDISDIYTIKIALDGLAAQLAATCISDEALTALEETLELAEFYLGKGDLDKLVELDSRFHDTICMASNNRPLRAMMSSFHNYIKMARHASLTNPGRPVKSLEEHRAMLEAIRNHDAELAGQLAVQHTQQVRGNVERRFAERGVSAAVNEA
ncbi:MAG: GntR family transcriptional regulator [Clostridiales bacterium]|nr:GntR family transcriptional regulator [Clostridiales bacterium]